MSIINTKMAGLDKRKNNGHFSSEDEEEKPKAKTNLRPKLLEIKKMSTQESQESTELDSLTVDMPTIMLSDDDELAEFENSFALSDTQDELGSHGAISQIPIDEEVRSQSRQSKAASLKNQVKSQVKGIVGKVKNVFGSKSGGGDESPLPSRPTTADIPPHRRRK